MTFCAVSVTVFLFNLSLWDVGPTLVMFCVFQVDIWEERKVFGSRVQSLKDEIMAIQGKDPVCQVASNGKSANPIKIAKKDAHSLRVVSFSVSSIYSECLFCF